MSAPFSNLNEFRALIAKSPAADPESRAAAAERNGQLTKPPGALGRLEDLAIWMAGWQGTDRPALDRKQVLVFAGNHGVTAQGVSAFPSEVTVQMVANFAAGGAAINQLAKAFGATLEVHSLSLEKPTADFTAAPAMTEEELVEALAVGWDAVDPNAQIVVCGEMGIGNTTVAAGLAAALEGGEGADWVGRGTGVDAEGLARKAAAVDAGLAAHRSILKDPIEVLRCLGGREIAAMAGAMAAARAKGIPVLLDGFIASSAALVLHHAVPGGTDHIVAGHLSAEGAHEKMLQAMDKDPLLSLGLRLGEGSGAALALGVMIGAVACHSGMSTFAEAGVSDG